MISLMKIRAGRIVKKIKTGQIVIKISWNFFDSRDKLTHSVTFPGVY